ncbi:phage/plasmid primase, P4 family [Staphylococcus agnetis]|uniref:phage/plasmid primase, P4 family n=1 Tax=Staphylococcus agnetis TaxID=985762 RepID=UPI00208F9CEE|nr:phage/plasmid primase, P4 family [Staphylococcus agnetis]MCO4346569.1 phage/plasmid primase, P4 family [Staphylococcus agnetis]MCO4356140.1 phage/plasmid primase, P4 family [Staphylococcus agnetis]MCO4360897.1 phage/plasmid primase, P4 family [Staphylococcus agnetis]MCO4365051.1 phage/plasmid primase, P4 family [Staphylococcus agnetis]MCO4372601.1 phage/plasmid primase, P4 family [Staphylococcus agnetis]
MYDNIPYELQELDHWCCFKIEQGTNGRKTKRPYNPLTNEFAKSNDESTWVSFEDAASLSVNYDGVGFFFKEPYIGVDLDDVSQEITEYLENNDSDNIISEFIDVLETYAEISPSGNGIHLILKGELPPKGRRRGNVEIYDKGRFFTMTGKNIGGYRGITEDEMNKLSYLHSKYILKPDTENKVINTSKGFGNDLSAEQIIDIAKKSKNGLRFTTLFEGDWSQFYNSQSEADLAFCNDLAFWTARDLHKMDEIFRKSVLYRDKWDNTHGDDTYGNQTINKAIDGCQNEFIPEVSPDNDFQIYVMDQDVKPAKKNKRYSYDDTGNAERLKDKFGDFIRYNYTANSWYYYDGKRWKKDDSGKMKTLVDKVVASLKDEKISAEHYEGYKEEEIKKFRTRHWKDSRNHSKKENMMKECQHLLPIHHHNFDTDFSLFNTQNGYIDLNTGTLHDHEKNKFFTKMSNTEYTDKSDCPIWINFLNDIFLGREELVKYIQRAIGYSLSGYTTEQVLFVLFGNGRNGKSVFLEIMSEVFGEYATNIRPQAIMAGKNNSDASPEIAKLDGARFVTTTEPNEGDRFDEGLLKQLTGGDKVSARRLYENEFEFTPQLKLWMATNHKPYVRGTDEGIWRRFVIIPFEKQIPLHEVDRELPQKLKEELPAIIKWCVDGYLEWQRIGLSEPEIVKEQRDEYRAEMDSTELFIRDVCETGETKFIRTSQLFKAYDTWARDNHQYRMSNKKFRTEMEKKFTVKKSSYEYYQGIQIEDDNYKPSFTIKNY